MLHSVEVSSTEWQIVRKLRELQATYANFTLKIYGQGSPKRSILDMSWEPRIRLTTTEPLSMAVDD